MLGSDWFDEEYMDRIFKKGKEIPKSKQEVDKNAQAVREGSGERAFHFTELARKSNRDMLEVLKSGIKVLLSKDTPEALKDISEQLLLEAFRVYAKGQADSLIKVGLLTYEYRKEKGLDMDTDWIK